MLTISTWDLNTKNISIYILFVLCQFQILMRLKANLKFLKCSQNENKNDDEENADEKEILIHNFNYTKNVPLIHYEEIFDENQISIFNMMIYQYEKMD